MICSWSRICSHLNFNVLGQELNDDPRLPRHHRFIIIRTIIISPELHSQMYSATIKVNMKESQTDLNKISVHKPLTNCGPSLVSKSTHLIPITAKWPWQALLYIRERQNLSQHIKLRWSKLKCNRSEGAVNEVSMDHDRSGWSVTILIQLDGWWLYRVIAPWDHPLLSGLESK